MTLIPVFLLALTVTAPVRGLSPDSSVASADSVIARYYQAIGGRDRLLAVKSRRLSGTYQEGAFSATTVILARRPGLRRVSVKAPDGFTYVEVFDGTSEYEFSDRFAKPVQLDTGAAERAGRRGAEFDESFVDWRAKGYSVESLGQQMLRGRPVMQLHVVLTDGWGKDYYFDVETGLLVALRKAMPLHAKGPDIESLSYYTEYSDVNGLLMPHAFEERNTKTDALMNELRWTNIELNVDIRDEAFHPPR